MSQVSPRPAPPAAPGAPADAGPAPSAPASGPVRDGRPHEFAWIWHSAQFSFGTVVLGAVPITLGLGWWDTVSAVLVGLAVGTAVFAPLVRVGLRTGLGDAESSAAQFGLRGRLLTHVITALVCLVFFTIAVWTGASAVLVAGQRLLGLPTDQIALAIVVPVVAAGVVAVAVFGHAAMMRTYRLLTVVGVAVLAGLVAVLAGPFDPGFAGTAPTSTAPGTATWLLAASFAATLPISYSTLQGDYARALHPQTSARAAVCWSGASMFTSNAAALLVGALVTTLITDPTVPWIVGMAALVPPWFVPVIVAFGILGTIPQAALCLYAAGLAVHESLRLPRVPATVAAAVVGLSLVYLGTVIWEAIDTISALVPILLVLVSPWSAIMLVGHHAAGGHYAAAELTRTAGTRSRYWYTRGIRPAAYASYLPGLASGLLLLDTSLFTGPLAGIAGGVDLSWIVPFALTAALYTSLLQLQRPAAATTPAVTP